MKVFPAAFISKIRELQGVEFDKFMASLEEPAPVSIRLNPSKYIPDFDGMEPVPWASAAYYLPERISFTLDPLFHAGCYYVQEASSMYLETVLHGLLIKGKPVKVLDLCAAPGGKSTHILSMLPAGSLLVSNEMIASRNIILQQNLTKWGFPNVVVTQNEASAFAAYRNFFDIIVADAPCSGEGLFRKQADATLEWSEAAVNHCAVRQRHLLSDVLPSLKSGGYLVYSTCTYEDIENENQCRMLVEEHAMEPVSLKAMAAGIVETEYGLRFYPHRVKGEGFFISALRKTNEEERNVTLKKRDVKKDAIKTDRYLSHHEDYFIWRKQQELYAFPSALWDDMHSLMQNLFVRKAGIHIGTMKGNDLVPSHDLALSIDLHPETPQTEFTLEESIRYLKCENVFPVNIQQGWSVATFNNFHLGWLKGIGQRVNNYFPRAQRILKSI